MILERTNIESHLQKLRERDLKDNPLLSLLEALHIEGSREETPENAFELDLLEPGRIYHLNQIREICVDFRLRFLDLKYFKPQLPEDAREAIHHLEDAHGITLKGLKIMAPSRLFKLEDKDDPLLMAPLGNGYYYLVHKWGNDLHPLRKLMVWPFRNIGNLTLVVLAVSFLLTMLIPSGLFSKSDSAGEFWMLFFFMFKSLAAVVIFYGFALGKNFNPAIWDSKYYNA
ncbi:hypothetical protein [Robiginitalea sediminis]|uniref:hypothetical protein n=1 Tax=Robiginitalea sediminis TaxID=1982593 RepID=UPI0018E92FDF|nr:hypothetical protein [Robiginitalea sediminis]